MKIKYIWIILSLLLFNIQKTYAQKYTLVDGPNLVTWLEQRIAMANKGVKEIVKIPIAFRGPYGCVCPLNFVGISPWSGAMDGTWIKPIFKNLKAPHYDTTKGIVILAEGYFSKRIISQDLRGKQKEIKEWIYQLKEFVVTKYQVFNKDCSTLTEENPVNPIPGCYAEIITP